MTMLGIAVYFVVWYAWACPEAFGKKIARIHRAYSRVMAGYSARSKTVFRKKHRG